MRFPSAKFCCSVMSREILLRDGESGCASAALLGLVPYPPGSASWLEPNSGQRGTGRPTIGRARRHGDCSGQQSTTELTATSPRLQEAGWTLTASGEPVRRDYDGETSGPVGSRHTRHQTPELPSRKTGVPIRNVTAVMLSHWNYDEKYLSVCLGGEGSTMDEPIHIAGIHRHTDSNTTNLKRNSPHD